MAKDSIQAPIQSADSVAVNTQIAVANDSVSTAKTDTIATVDAAASAATKEEDVAPIGESVHSSAVCHSTWSTLRAVW